MTGSGSTIDETADWERRLAARQRRLDNQFNDTSQDPNRTDTGRETKCPNPPTS